MNRHGNCHDNAVTEGFFQLLKRERIRQYIYTTREDARSDAPFLSKFSTAPVDVMGSIFRESPIK